MSAPVRPRALERLWLQLPPWLTAPDTQQPCLTAFSGVFLSFSQALRLLSVLLWSSQSFTPSLILFISALLSVLRFPPSFLGGLSVTPPTFCMFPALPSRLRLEQDSSHVVGEFSGVSLSTWTTFAAVHSLCGHAVCSQYNKTFFLSAEGKYITEGTRCGCRRLPELGRAGLLKEPQKCQETQLWKPEKRACPSDHGGRGPLP